MAPVLSVVVPFRNVEPYLEHCLSSLAAQEFADLQVVCVDDGSTDLSPVIAKDFAARDRRFTLVQQEQSGPGQARNTGIALAAGDLLAFADGDDWVPPQAYATLVASLQRTGSDLACGNVCWFDAANTWRSPAHAEMFAETVERTHVSRLPALLTDHTVWNKVYRRAFWEAAGLAFPRGFCEDTPVVIPAHVLADSVDVLSDVVYHWRQRDCGTRSLLEPGHLEDRISTVRTVREFLRLDHAELLPSYDRGVLSGDLLPFLKAFEFAGADAGGYRARFFDQVAPLLEAIPRQVHMGLPWMDRLAYHLVRARDGDELATLLADRRIGRAFGIRRGWTRFYADHPLRGHGGAPSRLFRMRSAELSLIARADQVLAEGAGFRILGHAYLAGLDARASKIRMWLRGPDGRRVEVPVRRVARPDVTDAYGHAAGVYDDSGFSADIDVSGLWTPPHQASWEVLVEVRNGWARSERALPLQARVLPANALNHWLSPSAKVEASRSKGNLIITARTVLVVAERCVERLDGLEVRGRVYTALRTAELTAAESPARLPVEFTRGAFRVFIPGGTAFSGALWLENGKERFKVFAAEDWAESSGATTGGERWLTVNRWGVLAVDNRKRRPVILGAEWAGGQTLRLRGRYLGTARPYTFRLERAGGGGVHELRASWEGQWFTVEFCPGAVPVFGEELPLASGTWRLTAPADEGRARVRITQGALREAAGEVTVGMHDVCLQAGGDDAAELRVRLAAGSGEAALQRVLEHDYPRLRTLPLLNLAVFESWQGRHCSDDPRAVFEELRRRGDGRECVWVTRDGQFEPPPGVRTVLSDSAAHVAALARAALIVANDCAPAWFVKREGQTYVQTWHGTPMKTIGHDVKRHTFLASIDYGRRLARDVTLWDLLVSPSPYASRIFRAGFDYRGEIAETGLPRNDQLFRPPPEGLRERLGVPAGKKVVLYAPTWRDDEIGRGELYRMNLRLDLPALRAELGRDHVLLVRAHARPAGTTQPLGQPGFAIDVTGYPEMAHLLALADVLVTDYSAAMFDFAVTGRPMVFFAPDLADYRDHVRGLYLDYAAEVPGPVAGTTAEVAAAVRQARAGYGKAFLDRFCPLEDGHAAARVVDRLPNLGNGSPG
ncbi:bifunctional glycosyltransferase/CDP-glycerol:glycerophosphate glycerophosphotransferase [Nonomuraea typhae]|uniref:bifunctional glycosyltransferase/CDP-glycerol:glycerophosphate glycerophosphotransferase n=1 Tax=Nonomuraea typhae TaxID=2603600 RepID=UPI0012F7585D|nr:bifunctional glycosyltransferase family 2 protein/CDP-glycerol:glycerophosphate glycerophosphotransferase [Nonomuraea typhae]